MKRCLTVACLLMLVASSVAGAATKGSKELIFGFSGLNSLGLDTYQGGFGLRHYMSDNMALRPSVNLGYVSNTTDATLAGYTDAKFTSSDIGLNVAMEKHMAGSKAISPYLGAGVGITMHNDETKPSLAPGAAVATTKVTNTGFGVFGLLGFQWSFTENLSLGGEYQLGLASTSRKTDYPGATPDAKTTGMTLGLSTVSLSLSVAL